MDRDALLALSKDDLIALILTQAAQISALTARVAELKAKLAAPKTPDNSSLPPSKCQKANYPDRPKKPHRGRPGVTRALAGDPDCVFEATLAACPYCTHPLAAVNQPDIHAYDHINLPPTRAVVTRIHRHRGVCPCCRKRVVAAVPRGSRRACRSGPGCAR